MGVNEGAEAGFRIPGGCVFWEGLVRSAGRSTKGARGRPPGDSVKRRALKRWESNSPGENRAGGVDGGDISCRLSLKGKDMLRSMKRDENGEK